MNNFKNEILCDCGSNLLSVGLIDSGRIYLSYSGDNEFKKSKFDFSSIYTECGECISVFSDEIMDNLSKLYPSNSDLNFEDITKSSIWFKDFVYVEQFCPHCGVDIKEEGLNYFVVLHLKYDISKNIFIVENVEKHQVDSFKCNNCDKYLYEIENINIKNDNKTLYRIPRPSYSY